MKEEYRALGTFGTLGLEIVLSVLLGSYVGNWLDQKFSTAPWLLIVGFFFGCGAAAKAVMRNMKDMRRVTEREEREQGNPAPTFEEPERRDKRNEREEDGEQRS